MDLTRIEDTDPGPPMTIQVSTVRIKENGYYKLTGLVRNDGAEVYGGVGVIATFFTGRPTAQSSRPGRGVRRVLAFGAR